MQEIRGPEQVPDTVPEELFAVYGEEARAAVRARFRPLPRRTRLHRRISGWIRERDPGLVLAVVVLWTVFAAAVGGLASMALLR
jgi:hypothetical protein